MKKGVLERIRQMLTPEIIILSAHETTEGIVAEVKQIYHYPAEENPNLPPITWAKILQVKANEHGNVFSVEGLF